MAEDKSLAESASVSAPTAPTSSAPATRSGANPDAQAVSGQNRFFNKRFIPLAIFTIAVFLFVAIAACWTDWQNTFFLDTDDAYVRADVTPLSTREHGIVLKTYVHDYQKVKAGDLLLELKNDDFKDSVQANLESVSQIQIKIDDMKSRKVKLDAQIDDASAQLDNSRSALKQFDSTIAIAKAAIDEAQASVEAADAVIKQSDAAVESAQADTVKTEASKRREEALLAEESSTKETVERVTDDYARAVAAFQSQKSGRLKAKAEWLAKKSSLLKAHQQLDSVLLDQQKATSSVKSKEAELVERKMERKLLDGEESQLRTELASKNYSADSAKITLGYTYIKAPVDGTVGELKVKAGQFVNAGTDVIVIVSAVPWVVANFRETQATKIKVGDRATLKIDALPGRHWNGRVQSVAPASGAQFSVLPPDNASGNFTKITQRIPVKIVFDVDASDTSKLEGVVPGLSVNVSISH